MSAVHAWFPGRGARIAGWIFVLSFATAIADPRFVLKVGQEETWKARRDTRWVRATSSALGVVSARVDSDGVVHMTAVAEGKAVVDVVYEENRIVVGVDKKGEAARRYAERLFVEVVSGAEPSPEPRAVTIWREVKPLLEFFADASSGLLAAWRARHFGKLLRVSDNPGSGRVEEDPGLAKQIEGAKGRVTRAEKLHAEYGKGTLGEAEFIRRVLDLYSNGVSDYWKLVLEGAAYDASALAQAYDKVRRERETAFEAEAAAIAKKHGAGEPKSEAEIAKLAARTRKEEDVDRASGQRKYQELTETLGRQRRELAGRTWGLVELTRRLKVKDAPDGLEGLAYAQFDHRLGADGKAKLRKRLFGDEMSFGSALDLFTGSSDHVVLPFAFLSGNPTPEGPIRFDMDPTFAKEPMSKLKPR